MLTPATENLLLLIVRLSTTMYSLLRGHIRTLETPVDLTWNPPNQRILYADMIAGVEVWPANHQVTDHKVALET